MKKLWLIITLLVISASTAGVVLHVKIEKKLAYTGFNWYESRNDSTIKAANEFAQERREQKYHVFLNGKVSHYSLTINAAFSPDQSPHFHKNPG